MPRRLAEQYGEALGLRWFRLPVALPRPEIRQLWHARLDADPAYHWLRETIRTTVASR